MLAAARRALLVFGATAGLTVAGSLVGALLLGADVARALATGFYVVGAFLVVLGFFAGNRGPLRPRRTADDRYATSAMFGIGLSSGGVRPATGDERVDALGTAWLFLLLGLALIAVGIVADSRFDLV